MKCLIIQKLSFQRRLKKLDKCMISSEFGPNEFWPFSGHFDPGHVGSSYFRKDFEMLFSKMTKFVIMPETHFKIGTSKAG